jgi:DNA helicase HerA-like ATPase
MLSLLHLAALSRSAVPIEERKQFHIYADEAHRFLTEALEDLIAETRKFSVSLTLAHHFLSQFGTKKIDALSSVGTTIIMNVDTKDARYLVKDLQDLVTSNDLITLEKGHAIARIGTDIVRLKTLGPLNIPEKHFRDDIIERSHKFYYKTTHVVRKTLREKAGRWGHPFSPLVSENGKPDEFIYDEF